MKYITGVQALNLPCKLNTTGDWHSQWIHWEPLEFAESDDSFFGDYGIELPKQVPFHSKPYFVANHIRALLDLLYGQKFSNTQGMKNDYIGNDEYTNEIFEKVYSMHVLNIWPQIDRFMEKEYKMQWIRYKEGL